MPPAARRDAVRAAYAAYHAIGLDEVIVGGADAPEDISDALAALRSSP